jgi:hypothetical protein
VNWKGMSALVLAISLPAAAALSKPSAEAPGKLELAQLPPPFGAPGPVIPGRQCSPQQQSLLKLQIEGFKQLQRLTRREGEALCATLDEADQRGVDKLIDPKRLESLLTPQQRELLEAFGLDLSKVNVAKIMRQLGIDLSQIDLRQLKQQCRTSKSELERFAASELARLENETLRCDDRV